MSLPTTHPTYNRENEQQTRNAINEALQRSVRSDVAQTRLLFIDQDTNETFAVTVESGVLVVTPL